MQKLSIVCYCHVNCTPLQSITRLPEAEAYQKAKELADSNSGTSFGRFADFHHYYPRRLQTEKWLYQHFIQLGGRPQSEHPLYFVLQGSDYLDEWFGKGKVIKLSLDEIDLKHISFTFGDSMAKMDRPERKAPFLKDTLAELIDQHGSAARFLDSIEKQYAYIEAQLWDDRYCVNTI